VKHGENYSKEIVTVETNKPEEMDVPEALDQIRNSVDGFFRNRTGDSKPALQQPVQPTKPAAPPSPQGIDASLLDRQPWTPMNKNPKGFWIYSDTPDAKALVAELIKAEKKTLTIGTWTYRLSCDGDRFINRWPHIESK